MNLTYEQEKIITTKDKTMLVSASAGSGKTFVVVEKIINSIVKDNKDIDGMLIVTFTNAAASELKERIVNKLQEALDKAYETKNKELIYHLSKQINKAWSANISTIHSFCLSVIKDNFYILGIDPNVTTIDATKASIMLIESINDVIAQEYEEKDESFYDILDLLGSEEKLISFTTRLYDFYSHITNKEEYKNKVLSIYKLGNDVRDLIYTDFGQKVVYDIKSRLQVCSIELERMISNIDDVDEFIKHKEILRLLCNNIKQVIETKTYDEIYQLIKGTTNIPNMPRYTGSDTVTKDSILNLRKKVVEEINEINKIVYKDTNGIICELNTMYPIMQWLFKYIEKIKENYSQKKLEKSVVDFTDYEELALIALKKQEVIDRYKEKFDVIYVDEYQDTSYVQEEIISQIARHNNVIMVGDVKQSIYGFRNAAPELFSGKYEQFSSDLETTSDNVKIVLADNFRSRKEVLNSINDIFEKIMTLEFGGARYTNKETLKYGGLYDEEKITDEVNPYTTELNLIEYNKASVDDSIDKDSIASIEAESIYVAEKIKQLINNFPIYDVKKKIYRKCEYKDIVILLQKVAGVAEKVEKTLKENGIPVYANNRTSFYETDEIKLIISFLKILDNELDDISLASVMYSKIGMFTLDDLVIIRNWKKDGYFYEALIKYEEHCKDKILYNKIESFLELIKEFKIYTNTYSLAEVIVLLYNRTGIYDSMLLEENGQLKQLNLDALVQIANNFEETKMTNIYSFIQYIESIKKREGAQGESPSLIGENDNVVRIMTIHHSKGLEFPVVIFMNSASSFDFQETKEKILLDNKLGIGINILDKKHNVTYPSILNLAIKSGIKYTLKSERLRLLYVALTRAKEKLIIYGTVKNADKFLENVELQVDNGKVSQTMLQQNNSQLKNIMAAIATNPNSTNINVNVISHIVESDINLGNEEVIEKISVSDKMKNILDKTNSNQVAKLIKQKQEEVFYKYPYKDASSVLQKYTATSINQKEKTDENLVELKPNMFEAKINNRGFGTCVHKIIENIDIKGTCLEDIIKETESVVKEYNFSGINTMYIASRIFNMLNVLKENIIKSTSVIEKEFEFIILDKLDGIKGIQLIERSYIQGVIDLYIETDNRNIIIDFKTDRDKTEQQLIEQYRNQLEIYRRGIELSLNKSNVEVYIYSFALEKLIKV